MVEQIHRHHTKPQGHKFSIGIHDGRALRGVAIAGNPVARGFDHKTVIEITRVATDGVPNGCSMLYGACCRAARAMGYRKAVTYTLITEPGVSLIAAGFVQTGTVRGRSWSSPSRPRTSKAPECDKKRWERDL